MGHLLTVPILGSLAVSGMVGGTIIGMAIGTHHDAHDDKRSIVPPEIEAQFRDIAWFTSSSTAGKAMPDLLVNRPWRECVDSVGNVVYDGRFQHLMLVWLTSRKARRCSSEA